MNETIKKDSQGRVLPRSELDFNLMTTNGVWGSGEISPELKDRLSKYYAVNDKDGQLKVSKENLWSLLGFYSRDLRLANLSTWSGEVFYCQYYLDLSADLLREDMVEPFLICLSRVASVLELSQSKGGFLRRRMNTFSQENITGEMEPKKKTLFGKTHEE